MIAMWCHLAAKTTHTINYFKIVCKVAPAAVLPSYGFSVPSLFTLLFLRIVPLLKGGGCTSIRNYAVVDITNSDVHVL